MKVRDLDWDAPDYVAVIAARMQRLRFLRENPQRMELVKLYYAQPEHVADFINDWGVTFDPRNLSTDRPAFLPFVLFPRQREWVEWFIGRWIAGDPGLSDKSRDMGVSWLAIAAACALCIFHEHMAVGFGSRKEEYVDKLGDPKSLFWKARMFMENLPEEFRAGWRKDRDAPHLRIMFPRTSSIITGESGDHIGRGDRTSLHVVDEAAYLERPHLTEASLSQTTRCRIDISSANGMGNPFAQKRHSWAPERIFTMHWRDDPRKGEAWYADQKTKLDPVTLAQEVDIDYAASVVGKLIPSEWIQAAVDAHAKLGFASTGKRRIALDVADQGLDLCATATLRGVVIEDVREWSGQGSDTYQTAEIAFGICDDVKCKELVYDADGLGAYVRGDGNELNRQRLRSGRTRVGTIPFQGSGAVLHPEREDVESRKNEDYFANRKAQAWWSLRTRFMNTWRAIVQGIRVDPEDIVSIPNSLPLRTKLTQELGQVTYELRNGKIIIIKTPEGMKSPNLADAVMMAAAEHPLAMLVSDEVVVASRLRGPGLMAAIGSMRSAGGANGR